MNFKRKYLTEPQSRRLIFSSQNGQTPGRFGSKAAFGALPSDRAATGSWEDPRTMNQNVRAGRDLRVLKREQEVP
jgi:hypothetical protein